jgi:hypothetical protein
MGGKQSASLFEGARPGPKKDFSKKASWAKPHKSVPVKSTPNSSYIKKDDKGNTITIRRYNDHGQAEKDIDYTNHGHPEQHPVVPHVHYWNWDNPDKPVRGPWRKP